MFVASNSQILVALIFFSCYHLSVYHPYYSVVMQLAVAGKPSGLDLVVQLLSMIYYAALLIIRTYALYNRKRHALIILLITAGAALIFSCVSGFSFTPFQYIQPNLVGHHIFGPLQSAISEHFLCRVSHELYATGVSQTHIYPSSSPSLTRTVEINVFIDLHPNRRYRADFISPRSLWSRMGWFATIRYRRIYHDAVQVTLEQMCPSSDPFRHCVT